MTFVCVCDVVWCGVVWCVQYYRDLGFQIALTYLEYWDIADRFIVSTQQRELLQKFQTYKSASLPKDQFDVVYFLT